MIEAIREIGEYSLRKDQINTSDPQGLIEIFCEDIQGQSTQSPHILTIDLEKNDNKISFIRVSVEEYKKEWNSRYLYRVGSSRGADITPTAMVTDIRKKTYPNKIKRWFNQDFSSAPDFMSDENLQLIRSITNCLNENESQILTQLELFLQNIRIKKESALVTLVLIEKSQRKYLGDLDLFRTIFIKKAQASLSQKYKTSSLGVNKICSVCRKTKPEVFGFVSTYNFYTVDKPGMVSGGFDQSLAWKNYPVCLDCALALERGKRYLKAFGHFEFYGFEYYIIPKPLFETATEVYEILKTFQNEGGGKKVRLTESYQVLMSDTEEEILKILSEKENLFLCNILIYSEDQKAFKIECYIEDIFPSRLKQLFDAKNVIDKKGVFKSFLVPIFIDKKKPELIPFTFSFSSLHHFFGKDSNVYFFDIISRIFSDKPISYQFVLSEITKKIRRQYNQNVSTKETTLRGLALLAYLNELDLFGKQKAGSTMTSQPKSIVFDGPSETKKKVEEVFEEFPAFFNSAAKRAVFLEGVLCEKLLKIQKYEREGATPFRIRLQGLKLDQSKVQALLPQIQNKLEEYKSNYYRDLEQLISASMIEAGDNWKLSKDEIAFYFVLGMNLADQFTNKKQDVGGKKDE